MKRMKKALALGLWLLGGQVLAAAPAPPGVVEAPVLAAAPEIDGRLDEPAWQDAARIEHFVQVDPDAGAPATERTLILIGYDQEKLYIAARCYDSEPEKINSVRMARDAELFNEDSVGIVLDTFHDKKNGFFFAINPVGAQIDALVRGDGDEVNTSWDGIWYSATSRDQEGWTAELAIPFRTLRFPKDPGPQTWGLNVGRTIIHKREYVLWQPAEAILGWNAVYKVSAAGALSGLQDLKQGRQFDVKPYLLARTERSDLASDDEDFEVGVDVRKNLTSDLTLDLTYNLDFAEAEADNQQVNLTRFPLFFPEKRDFFLEGASLFYFGERADQLRTPERIFFFSRRIGLSEDGRRTIPLLGGAKISGRVGGLDLGFLNLTSEELTYQGQDGEEQFAPQTNYTVLRIKKRILEKSAVGLMGLMKEVRGGADNSGAGVDWDFALGPHLKTGGFLARTSTPELEGDDWAGMADVVWEGRSLFAKASYADVGDHFNPEMGFFQRLGVREWRGALLVPFRPQVWNLRHVVLVEEFTRISDQNGDLESQFNQLWIDVLRNDYAGTTLKFYDQIEVLTVPFEIHPGVVVAPGRYHFSSYFVGGQTATGRPVFVFGRVHVGDFYDGKFRTLIAGARLRPLHGLYSRLFYEHTEVDLPAGEFTVELASLNLTYSLSPTLSGRALVEWRSDDNLSANVAIKWTYKPGAALYLVYNGFRDLVPRPGSRYEPTERSLIAKVTFYF